MLIDYPLLAVAYLTDRFGAFVEPIFFVCFSSWWLSNSWNRDERQPEVTRSRSADCRRGSASTTSTISNFSDVPVV